MIRSELLQKLAQDNPELRAQEIEQVVDIFFEEIAQRLRKKHLVKRVLDVPLRHVEFGPASELQRSESPGCREARLRRIPKRAVGETRVGNNPERTVLLPDEEDTHRGGRKKSR